MAQLLFVIFSFLLMNGIVWNLCMMGAWITEVTGNKWQMTLKKVTLSNYCLTHFSFSIYFLTYGPLRVAISFSLERNAFNVTHFLLDLIEELSCRKNLSFHLINFLSGVIDIFHLWKFSLNGFKSSNWLCTFFIPRHNFNTYIITRQLRDQYVMKLVKP